MFIFISIVSFVFISRFFFLLDVFFCFSYKLINRFWESRLVRSFSNRIVFVGSEKRQATQFTPRLGRESGEEYFSYGFPRDQEELYAEEQIFPPLFAPRLGRRLPWTPSPRLGRQLHVIGDKPRQNFDDARF